MSKRRWIVLALGLGALGTLGGMAPWAYRRIHVEALLARLEEGPDESARKEILAERALGLAGERLLVTRDPELARNLVEIAGEGLLQGPSRRAAFDVLYPVQLALPKSAETVLDPTSRLKGRQLVSVKAQESNWELVKVEPWCDSGIAPVLGPGRLAEHVQYFIAGEGDNARLVFQRALFVLDDFDPTGNGPGFRTVEQDLTAVPDPINLYLRRPRRVILPSGESALELRVASMGTWRQFIPGRRLYDGSVAYKVFLDRSGERKEPFLLGRVAVSAARGAGKWFAEDDVLGKKLENLDRGSHWIDWTVPESSARLHSLQKLRLLFRPAPSYAQELGFEVSATNCLPFEREYYLPEPER